KTIQGADSPFGRTTTYASIGAVTRDDLLAWHKKYFHPNRIIVGVVGDITVEEARALVSKAFGDWPKGPPMTDTWPVPRTAPTPPSRRSRRSSTRRSCWRRPSRRPTPS